MAVLESVKERVGPRERRAITSAVLPVLVVGALLALLEDDVGEVGIARHFNPAPAARIIGQGGPQHDRALVGIAGGHAMSEMPLADGPESLRCRRAGRDGQTGARGSDECTAARERNLGHGVSPHAFMTLIPIPISRHVHDQILQWRHQELPIPRMLQLCCSISAQQNSINQ